MRKKTFLKIVELQTKQSGQHLDEVRSIHREMRGYKHDVHHHLQTLRMQIELGEYDRALKYIDELDADLLKVDTLMKTGTLFGTHKGELHGFRFHRRYEGRLSHSN